MQTSKGTRVAKSGRQSISFEALLGIIAMSLMMAEFWFVVSFGLAGDTSGRDQAVIFSISDAMGQVLCLLLSIMFKKRVAALLRNDAFVGVCAAIGFICVVVAENLSLPVLGIGALAALFGIVSGLLWVLSTAFISRCDRYWTTLFISISALLGWVIYSVAAFLPFEVGRILMALYTPASLILFRRSEVRSTAGFTTDDESLKGSAKANIAQMAGCLATRWPLGAVVLCLGFIFGTRIITSFIVKQTIGTWMVELFCIPGLVLLFNYYVAKRPINLKYIGVPVVIALLASMSYWGGNDFPQATYKWIIVFLAFNVFDYSTYITFAEVGEYDGIPVYTSILIGRFLTMAAVLIGELFCLIAPASEEMLYAVDTIEAIAVVGTFALFWLSSRPLDTRVPSKTNQPYREACRLICAEYRLTSRETDVFMLLAKGYNAKRVSEDLVISLNTAKTHIKNIHSKLGAHSQQDIIEIVENKKAELRTDKR